MAEPNQTSRPPPSHPFWKAWLTRARLSRGGTVTDGMYV